MTEGDSGGDVRIEVTAEQSWEAALIERTAPVLREPEVVRDFPEGDHWLVGWDVSEKVEGRPYFALIQDSSSGRATLVDGRLDDPADTAITYLPHQRPPSDDEFAWAVARVVETEPDSGEEPYRPFPPLANVRLEDGTVRRMVAVGLRSTAGAHRRVGVEGGSGDIVAVGLGEAVDGEYGAAPTAEPEVAASGAHQARVRMWRGEEVLWDLVVVRPSASSGTNGSGVELRAVEFGGARLLDRAHVPIVTVTEGEGSAASGERVERLWANEEGAFEVGSSAPDPAEGFRLCDVAPRTVLDTGSDGGGFRGVALWLDGPELRITSQLRAGWHRLVQEWRLALDGSMRARVGYAPARRPGPARPAVVRAYWRFDFDILGPAENTVQEHNDPPAFGRGPWHTIRYELRRPCATASDRYWRVRSDRASRSYSLVPDDSGEDVWALRYHAEEVDDGVGAADELSGAAARLDDFVSGEPVHREDLVLWHSTALVVDPAAPPPDLVGPDLTPRLWTEAAPLPEPALLEPEVGVPTGT